MTVIRGVLVFMLLSFSNVCGIHLTHQSSPGARVNSFRSIAMPYHAIVAPLEDVSSLPGNLSRGNLLAYEPSVSATDDLFLFLPGSGFPCEGYSELLETTAPHMYTVCVPYDNRLSLVELCGENSNCYPDLRLEAFNGSFVGVRGNNIELRLASALTFLARSDSSSWSRYLDNSTGLPVWSRVRLAGHSQGAGLAVMVAYFREVARVVQFSGVCDHSDWTTTLGPPRTPSSRFYGLASSWDSLLCPTFMRQIPAWYAEGSFQDGEWPAHIGIRDNVTVTNFRGSHTVLSYLIPDGCDMIVYNVTCDVFAHNSVALNGWPGGSPYARGVWQKLCGI